MSRAKDILTRISEVQKQIENLEPQVAHYLTLVDKPGISFSDKTKAMDKVKQIRAQQAERSRSVLNVF